MVDQTIVQNKFPAVQDNQLIEACYSMTLNEKRLLLLGISKIDALDNFINKPMRFEVTAKEWQQQFNDDSPWRTLKRTADKLLPRQLLFDPKVSTVIKKVNWFDSVYYFVDEGFISVQFSDSVKGRLYGLQGNFTQLEMLSISELNSIHAVRLYELLKQYLPDNKRKISLEGFRFAMDCVDKHKTTKKLKAQVLNPALKQVNEKSDIFCTVTDVKEGRSITGFFFSIRQQEQKQLF
jgi:plasmid replication initiation protein|tara:strand:+ start:588 stop:1295 length:708 start_codon:yes stop_codon:yes gene_type:complete